ncbi:MAG: YbaB/EbfC family nucleoid-associated protein [Spirochaetales bacterium]|nr:YbaB/EbfC family nucleoid-associated protein [Spirochaetales bacterium]
MNPFELLKNAQAIKEQMARMQERLPEIRATGNAGAGMVTITLNGTFTVVDVTIEEEAAEDLETLRLLLQSAFNDASAKLQRKLQDEGLKAASMMGQP